ncbi:septal ring lytic transglycosylase RlpA family protein [Martelella lutilitoris]|uniref:Endolytic peptidoglycan transglycosylase RlpA n=2 Tax=Martelella lutilitoris TaxID=2583532 RepID=A0A5C4JNV4_9HYPH|nr:septal ring lytic transglycosylase RlpA family protein [Martelella lutilitoris]
MREFRLSASVAMLAVTAMLSACTTTGDTSDKTKDDVKDATETAAEKTATSTSLGYQKIGKPYQVKGKWYTPKHVEKYSKEGLASWYGPNFNGGRTANGETYDMNHLSAAHKTLPLPSYVRVTNKKNDSSVIVRVNDRGPFVSGRIIDLSKKAAEMLDMTREGVADVRIDYIGPAPQSPDDMDYLLASYEKKVVPEGVDPARFGEGGVQLAQVETKPTAERSNTLMALVDNKAETKPAAMAANMKVAAVASAKAPQEALALVDSVPDAPTNAAGQAAESILTDDASLPVVAPIPFKK